MACKLQAGAALWRKAARGASLQFSQRKELSWTGNRRWRQMLAVGSVWAPNPSLKGPQQQKEEVETTASVPMKAWATTVTHLWLCYVR